ncbi:MAG: glycosyltransferase family 4 protein [Planctomycetota bacterium]|jgi:glycosyltransferase involved in cell wall biosynthesis
MRLLIALEHHFIRCPEGIFTDLAFAYDYWKEYLEVFDEVVVTARIKWSAQKPEGLLRADGEGVLFFGISDYHGLISFLIRLPLIFYQAFKATRQADRYLLRAGAVGMLVWINLLLAGKARYAFECMTHIKEGIATERPNSFLHKTIGAISHCICKTQAKRACCSSYTSEFLHRAYPCTSREVEFVFSGVRLSQEVITSPRPKEFFEKLPFRFISIGRLERQKGHAWLVEASRELCKHEDLPEWTLDIVGPGSQVKVLRERVNQLRLDRKVEVVGGLPWGQELFSYIDNSHLFILPSLTEGMPRALIEGMARGIPAIGANTGGIPELLEKEALVEVGDVMALVNSMVKYMMNPDKLAQMSASNFKRAQDFKIVRTKTEKLAFWKMIHDNSVDPVTDD